jgi:transcriptional regulator with XRE-family HTH domain
MELRATALPLRLIARKLLELRAAADLTRDRASQRAEISSQTLWRLENGLVTQPKKMVIRVLCDVYNASDEDRRILLWLVEESRKTGWWQSYSDALYDNKDLFIELEQAACHVTSFKLALLPGMVQTPDYRRALARNHVPALTDNEIDQHLELLAKRQERLEESPDCFSLDVLLSESALRHPIGGAAVMAAQARHLLELSHRPNVSIRIIPLTAGDSFGLEVDSFVFLDFPEHPNPALTEPPVVYIEGYTGALYLDKPDEIEQYRIARSHLESVALGTDESRVLLVAIAEEYEA